jgi:hypothetical protein
MNGKQDFTISGFGYVLGKTPKENRNDQESKCRTETEPAEFETG